MEASLAIRLIDRLIRAISEEINAIKSRVGHDLAEKVAIYSHDHIGADRMDFGALSNSPTPDQEYIEELAEIQAVLLDREQRRNALKHLKRLIEEGDDRALQTLREGLELFFAEDEQYEFIFQPEAEYPNEYVQPYPYSEEDQGG